MIAKSITFQEKKICYYAKGNISENALIFIHGNSLNAKTFIAQFENINNLPLLAIDLPGHGESDNALSPEKTYSIPGYIEVLNFVIKELNLKNYILVGHSLGGHIALEASTELNNLKALFIFGSPPLGIPLEMDKAFLPNASIPYLMQEVLNDTEAFSLANALVKPPYVADIEMSIQNTDGKARSSFLNSIGAGLFKNEKVIIENLKIPIAIVHGEEDSIINKNYIDSLIIPTLFENKVTVIKNATHSPQIENPELFNQLLLNFYQSVKNG